MFHLPKLRIAFKVVTRDRFEAVAANTLPELGRHIEVCAIGPVIRSKQFKLRPICGCHPVIVSRLAGAFCRSFRRGASLAGGCLQGFYLLALLTKRLHLAAQSD